MKKKTTRIISILLVSVIIISSTLFFVLGADEISDPMELTKIDYQYKSETAGSTLSNSFYYSDYMLFEDANEFSEDMAKASVATAVAVYGTNNINSILSQMKYNPVEDKYNNTCSYNYNYNLNLTIDDNDHVAYSVGQKEVKYNGETYIMYCVPVKGTSGNAEWFSNFNLGTGNDHEGFYKAANEVLDNLYAIFNSDGYDANHRIIWLSGHSRGAAVANIIGGKLSESGRYASTSNIFAYSFACPSVSKNANTSLNNVYYFNNPGDLIPALPLREWGYKCYGKPMYADMGNWDNVCYQFKRITGVDFASLSSTKEYTDSLSLIVGSAMTYNDPIVKLGVNFVAYVLGGKTDASYVDVLNKYAPGAILSFLLYQVPYYSDFVNFVTGTYDLLFEHNEGVDLASAAISATKEMTDEEYENWASSHRSDLAAISNCVGYTVSTYGDLCKAYNDLVACESDLVKLCNLVPNLVKIFVDSSGNPMNAITHGHEQLTYTAWINSLYYGTEGWYNSTEEISVNMGLNNSYIGDRCFYNSAITKISLSSDVLLVPANTFYNCTGLTEVDLSNGLETIGEYAFYNCTGLTEIEIPNSVRTIGQGAFRNTNLTKVTLPFVGISRDATGSNAYFYYVFGYEASYVPSTLKEVVITDATQIGDLAFASCRNIEKVTINEGITTLGSSAFSGCSNLKEINLPESLTSTGNYAFQNCTSLTSMDLPKNLIEISYSAFSGCIGLKEINFLPDSLKTIGRSAFSDCTGITKVEFPDSVETIGSAAFYKCLSLTDVTFSKKLKFIGADAFAYCVGLTEIDVPNSVTSIGQNAFYKCDFLDVIKINSYNCSIYNNANTIPFLAVIYCCPGSTAEAYAEWHNRDYVANHTFENNICIYCNTAQNLVFVEEDKHIEGLVYELNSVTQIQLDMNLDGKYITVFDVNGKELTDNDYIGTGAKVYIYDSATNKLLDTYTVVLYGDVNGDGLINSADQEIITNVATCQSTINNEWFIMAADTNHDGAVDGFDVIETELQALDMHNIEQVNNTAYIKKDEETEKQLVA